jgi:hypothetical protein
MLNYIVCISCLISLDGSFSYNDLNIAKTLKQGHILNAGLT